MPSLIASPEHLACTACSLANAGRTQVVPGYGPADAQIALVGEAPGATEDQDGKPFLGRAGKLLDRLLASVGLAREEIWITNRVHCRPPHNDLRPYPDAVVQCPKLWLHSELGALDNLRVIVAMGATAASQWFPGKKVGEVALLARAIVERMPTTIPDGSPGWDDVRGLVVVGAYHPAAALRSGEWVESSIQESLRRARSLCFP